MADIAREAATWDMRAAKSSGAQSSAGARSINRSPSRAEKRAESLLRDTAIRKPPEAAMAHGEAHIGAVGDCSEETLTVKSE